MRYILEYKEFDNLSTEEQEIKDKAISDGTFMKATNGAKSNLSEKQWLQVRTSNFINWFGDWLNNPKTASKIVDENGEPLILYHGSRYKFDIFDNSKLGESNKTARVGFWFADTKNFAKNFADSVWYGNLKSSIVYDVYLNIRNPKIYKSIENNEDKSILNQEIKRTKKEIDSLSKKWSFSNPTCVFDDIKVYQLAMDGKSINNDNRSYYSNKTQNSKDAIKDGEKTLELKNNLKALENEYYNYVYSDAYEQFRTDIYKIEGKNAEIANIGGLGMTLDNTTETINKYVDNLKNDGFDGIIIKDTIFDKDTVGEINTQYVGLISNQIKSATNNNGDFNPNNKNINE